MKSYLPKLMFLIVLACALAHCGLHQGVVQRPRAEITAPSRIPVIEKISLVEGGNSSRIVIEASEPIALPFYKVVSEPLRIAIDIPNVDLKQVTTPLKVENGTIREVTASQHEGRGSIEIGLVQMANYHVMKDDRVLTIDVEKAAPVLEVKDAPPETPQESLQDAPKEPPPQASQEEPPVQVSESPLEATSKEESPPSPPSPAVKKAREVTDLRWEDKKSSIVFSILGDGAIENYNALALDNPPRLALDLLSLKARYPQKSAAVNSPLIQKVRTGVYTDKVRLVFDATKGPLPPYEITRTDTGIVVSFGNAAPRTEPRRDGEAPLAVSRGARTSGTVTRIDFKEIDRKARIIVGTTAEPEFEARMISKEVCAVDVKNAAVPKQLQRPLDARPFGSAVQSVEIHNVRSENVNHVRLSIALKEEVPCDVTREGKLLYVDIGAPREVEVIKTAAKINERETASDIKTEDKDARPAEETPAPSAPPQASPEPGVSQGKTVEEGRTDKGYNGRKISLDFKDADIKNILRLIAEVSNLNIIAGDDVQGKVSMRLVDVPWDQALDVVLQSRSLGKNRVGNVLRIAPLETLKREDQAELEARRAKEKLEDLTTELVAVNYATAKEILPQVKSVMSERGDVRVDDRTNILILKDIAKNVMAAKSLVKSLDSKTPQVLIEARIVEANVTFQRELGVSWGLKVKGAVNSGTGTIQGGLGNSKIVDLPAIAKSGAGSGLGTVGIIDFMLQNVGALELLDIAISAHENKGDVKVISSPKVATLDNKEASVEQGLRIPYLKLTTEGTVTTDFIDANLKLTVIPHVTNDGNIKLNIRAKKDAPDQTITVQGVPSIDKKEAITEVLIKDNGVVVIAGIYTIEKNEGVEGIPLFGNIPLLGWLFRREAKSDQRKDLLIFISPRIITDQV
jgi:type IV pilus assembly protein PilQ